MIYVLVFLGGLVLGIALADLRPLKLKGGGCTVCGRPQAEHSGYAQLHVWEGEAADV